MMSNSIRLAGAQKNIPSHQVELCFTGSVTIGIMDISNLDEKTDEEPNTASDYRFLLT